MRQFALKNEQGISYELNSISTGFLSDPEGLGHSVSRTFTRVGSCWIASEALDEQPVISGSILFAGSSPYAAFASFSAFIRSSNKLKIIYTTTAGTYYRDVVVKGIEKSEIGRDFTLKCDVKLSCISLWYTISQRTVVLAAQRHAGEARYSFRWPARFNDYSNSFIDVENDGSVPMGFSCEIQGAIDDPVFILSQSGAEIARVEFNTTLTSSERIKYSSVDGDLYCLKTNGMTETNLLPNLNITNTNFFKFPIGTSRLKVESDTPITNPVLFTFYRMYRTV